jgi:hypothetical protein
LEDVTRTYQLKFFCEGGRYVRNPQTVNFSDLFGLFSVINRHLFKRYRLVRRGNRNATNSEIRVYLNDCSKVSIDLEDKIDHCQILLRLSLRRALALLHDRAYKKARRGIVDFVTRNMGFCTEATIVDSYMANYDYANLFRVYDYCVPEDVKPTTIEGLFSDFEKVPKDFFGDTTSRSRYGIKDLRKTFENNRFKPSRLALTIAAHLLENSFRSSSNPKKLPSPSFIFIVERIFKEEMIAMRTTMRSAKTAGSNRQKMAPLLSLVFAVLTSFPEEIIERVSEFSSGNKTLLIE